MGGVAPSAPFLSPYVYDCLCGDVSALCLSPLLLFTLLLLFSYLSSPFTAGRSPPYRSFLLLGRVVPRWWGRSRRVLTAGVWLVRCLPLLGTPLDCSGVGREMCWLGRVDDDDDLAPVFIYTRKWQLQFYNNWLNWVYISFKSYGNIRMPSDTFSWNLAFQSI